MTLTGIIFILLIGIIFLILEIVVIPGVGVAGILSLVLLLSGVYLAYDLNTITGHYCLAGTVVSGGILLALSLRSNTWNKVSLHKTLDQKLNTVGYDLKVGDTGNSINQLTPTGKAMFNDKKMEVRSMGPVIDQNSEIIITKIEGNNVFVQVVK